VLIACGARTELGAPQVGDAAVVPDVHVVDAHIVDVQVVDVKPPPKDAPSPCVFPDIAASILTTADDQFYLYVNDQLIGSSSDWTQAQSYTAAIHRDPGMKNVIAIQGTNLQNTGGRDRGVLLDMRFTTEAGQQTIVTDTKWRMSTGFTTNWSATTFDDSSWATAVNEGAYPEGPWGFVLGTSSNADWLWSYDSNLPSSSKVVSETVYFRRDFYLDPTGHVSDTPSVCD
jgi:hypothetical protein